MPRFLVDESVTVNVRVWLKKKGFDTMNVSDMGLKGALDQEVAEYAIKNDLTIITLDMDYAQIYHNSPKGILGVIVVRANPSTPNSILETMEKAHGKINLKKTEKKLFIITKRRIRIIS